MPIQEYYDYQMRSSAFEPQNITDEDGMIQFGVNVDIESWHNEMKELKAKIPKQFLFDSEADVMSYLKQKIKGISLPQLYLKVPSRKV